MKRTLVLVTTLCAISLSVSAQVSKQVEVEKDYKPSVEYFQKLDIKPNTVDTMKIIPDVDFAVTSHSFASTLGTRSFNPATPTYWEFQRRYPFYLKLGAGYPLNTEGDLYATLHRAGVGYVTGYINHSGLYSKLKYHNGLDNKQYKDNRSMQMNNRFGVSGGKYFGRYTLAGDLYYDMDLYHRYPLHNVVSDNLADALVYKRRRVDFGDLNFAVNFGDKFVDYSHLNFKVYATLDYFHDKSENFVVNDRYQQINVTAGALLAREINKRNSLSLDIDYEGYYGLRSLKGYENSMVGATVMYRYRSNNKLSLNIGAKVCYDHNAGDVKSSRWHGFPMVNVSMNVGERGLLAPFVEVDGSVQNNSYYSLVKKNPYVAILGVGNGMLQANSIIPNTEAYNVRFGVSGHLADSKLAYRGYVSMSFRQNDLYWFNVNQIFFDVIAAKRNVWALCGAVDYRPISDLLLTAQVKGMLYSDYAQMGDLHLAGALPNVELLLKARYSYKDVTLGGSLELYGPTKWTWIQNDKLFNPNSTMPVRYGEFTAPTSLNFGLFVDWHISKFCTVFLEGNNLFGDLLPTYRWAFYREMGASFTAGVKVQF